MGVSIYVDTQPDGNKHKRFLCFVAQQLNISHIHHMHLLGPNCVVDNIVRSYVIGMNWNGWLGMPPFDKG